MRGGSGVFLAGVEDGENEYSSISVSIDNDIVGMSHNLSRTFYASPPEQFWIATGG
jgi:hypothetical protein